MKKIIYILLISLMSTISYSGEKKPEWILDPSGSCDSKLEICAIGSSGTLNSAKIDARNGIAKFLETSVSSKFSSTISADNVESYSKQSESLEEVTEGILKGSEIKYTYDDGNTFYAFAVLDKKKFAKELKDDITKIDEKMNLLLSEGDVKYNKQLEKLYFKRDILNKKYLVVTGNLIPETIKYEQIFANKKNTKQSSRVYFFEKGKDSFSRQIIEVIKSNFSENGVGLTSEQQTADMIVKVSVVKNDLHLNVQGFIKQMYNLTIEVIDNTGRITNNVNESFVEVGRSEAQIKDIVLMNVRSYMQENLENLL